MRIFASIAISALIVVTVLSAQPAQGQTFTVIHNFTGYRDGANPISGLTIRDSGTLYGTTSQGGGRGGGVVFKMKHSAGGWALNPIYAFTGGSDGSEPLAGVVIGPNGALYGTTWTGGPAGAGTVFKLTPPPKECSRVLCYWNETVLYSFTGGSDGASPAFGNLIFDQAGNIYGTTQYGGGTGCQRQGCGVVFKLAPSSGGQWTESVLHSFGSGSDGQQPLSGVIFDVAGNLYGTTSQGGSNQGGTVFEMTPFNGTWLENILFDFDTGFGCDLDTGCAPAGTLIMDTIGSLYGTAQSGAAFELTPSSANWTFSVLSFFCCQPVAGLTMDAAGDLYGVTVAGGAYGYGMLFKLTNSGGQWTFTDLHDFTDGYGDGGAPYGAVVIDASGNLFGTAYEGGTYGYGVVWAFTP
jgi:uncharacterized repeat protein (TIGR03803 family)